MKIFIRFTFLVVLFSCQKEISISPKTNYQEELYLEGMLYPGKPPRIYLSRALPFFESEVTPQDVFARGATVVISNQGIQYTLSPDSVFDSFRCRWTPFYGGSNPVQYGETYDLFVTYNGKTVVASTTIDQPKVEIASLEYTAEFFDVYGGHDGVIVSLQDVPGSANYYRFQMNRMIDNTRNHAHILDVVFSDCTNGNLFHVVDLGRTIFNDKNIDGQLLTMPVEVSFECLEGDTAYVFMQSLDQRSALFYESVDRQLESIFNPFVEPVFLNSQLDGAIGVFGSAVLSDSVLFIYPQDFP